MTKIYRIDDVCPLLDGQIVEGFEEGDRLRVTRLYGRDIGPLEGGGYAYPATGLLFDMKNMVPIEETEREFLKDNPFGQYLSETRVRRKDLEVVITDYEHAATVAILEHWVEDGKYSGSNISHVKTRYSQNFFNSRKLLMDQVNEEVKKGDLDELIFVLRALKATEIEDARRWEMTASEG